jgi:hypothetical protein
MSLFAGAIVDWGALWQVIYISAIAGLLIATVLGVGIAASLRSTEPGANTVALRAVTGVSVLLVAAAVVVGLLYMFDK